jgi:AcrR family transcriptional regulator
LPGKEKTKNRLIKAVGKILSRDGFKGLGVNKVAHEAGVDKVLIYRYFGGLPELIAAFSRTVDFWPDIEELMGPNPGAIKKLGPEEQMAFFFKSFLGALKRRPMTQNIMIWKASEEHELAARLDDIQMRSALEFFESLENIPTEPDLTAVVVLMFGAITSILIQSQTRSFVGGVDLSTEAGWKRIDAGIDLLFRGTFKK